MRDRLLTYAVAVSIGVHIVILGVVGRTSAARPIDVEDLKLVRVEVVDVPENVNVSEPKPAPKPEPGEPAHVSVPPPESIPVVPPPKPRPFKPTKPDKSGKTSPAPSSAYSAGPSAPSNKLPGDPGGELNLGSSSQGDVNVGPGGKTPVGWVPGAPGGKGVGSGIGEGVGTPEPPKNASPGPGTEPSPPPPPPPPPPDVDVKVCSASGMLPGPNCEQTAVRSFRPGKEPDRKCAQCQPKHVSTLADRAEPELISGSKRPKYPTSARDQGVEGSVTVEYTINTDGNVVGVKVSKSSGNSDLDRAATQCVESRKYKPAVQGGIPRNFRKRETFHFALD